MNTKPLIFLLLLIALSGGVNAYWCYQESANVSNQGGMDGNCGLNYSGIYGFAGSWLTSQNNLIDGDWATSAQKSGFDAYFYINYTKSPNSLSTSLWQIKDGGSTKNLTIPQDCWIYNDTQLMFFVGSASSGSYFYCYNSSTLSLQLLWHNESMRAIHEEAMWWNVTTPQIDTCDTFTNNFANFSLYTENSPTTKLNGTLSATASFNFMDSMAQNVSVSIPNTNKLRLCSNINSTIRVNLYLQSIISSGYTHRFYLYNQDITSIGQTFDLYNFNYTTGLSLLQLTVRDYFTNNIRENILVLLQRFYPGTGAWLTVQEYQTDSFGLATFNIIELTTDYKLIFMDQNNNVLATTDPMAFSCNSYTFTGQGVCQLTYQLNNQTSTQAPTTLTIDAAYNATLNAINLTWNDPLGATSTVVTTVKTQTYTGTQTLCTQSQTGSSGLVNCPTSGYTGSVLVQVTVNSNLALSQYIDLNTTTLGSHLDPLEGAFWSAMIIITCAGFGMAVSPAAGMIAIMVGLIAIFSLGLFSAVTLTFLIIAGVLSIAVGWRLRQ